MLVLFTDFGVQGPYIGLLKLPLVRYAPAIPVIDLFHDVPAFDPQAGAYLLAAYAQEFPKDSVFIGVVDPGVGGTRPGMMLKADGQLFIGPDNGLFDRIAVRAQQVQIWHISWRPRRLSASFHGRDIFAPVAAMLATKTAAPDDLGMVAPFVPQHWPDDLARIVYVDHFGNAMTGIRAASLATSAVVHGGGTYFRHARTFSDVPPGRGFWYENSSGLVELAVNQGNASARFGLFPGVSLQVTGETFTVIQER